jgi:hypothetical protein
VFLFLDIVCFWLEVIKDNWDAIIKKFSAIREINMYHFIGEICGIKLYVLKNDIFIL